MAHKGDQRGEGHDQRAGANGALALHAQEGGEDYQHHHAAAAAHKPGAKTDGQPEEEGNGNTLPVKLGAFLHGLVLLGIRLEQETNANAHAQEKGEGAQHHMACVPGGDAAGNAHGNDARQHNAAALQVDVPVPDIDGRGEGRAKDVRGQGDGGGVISTGLASKGGTEDDHHRHHNRGGR